ncbi:thioredoxin family protein [Roseospira navarrensis]|uniref:Tetratricopeptide repeat protein n=1 Tax=Roseospira navarrensis TaxID=140058 RepID=A0A7X1ZIX5_9PROT|nr:co-chaperone YbbN [Roseospira navarrensis]MQX38070.1 tetratricopeptide repeat protein [Roseospira navarrensis]
MALILDGEGTTVGTSAPTGGGDLIKDGNIETFMQDVIEASQSVPVVVEFWTPRAGPGGSLGPLLEKLVRQLNGAVRMVKINVDENQQLAAQLRVQSVPTVYGFKQGQPVDAFAGALPESQLKQFLSGLTGGAANPVDAALEEARQALDGGDFEGALMMYRQILERDQGNTKAIGGYLRALVANGQTGEAAQILAQLPEDFLKDPDIVAAKTKLELAQEGAGPVSELRAAVEADPDNHQARYDLANALYAGDQAGAAIDELLEIYRRDRAWNEDAARQRLLKIFEALGPGDPVAAAGRRRLSSLIFS